MYNAVVVSIFKVVHALPLSSKDYLLKAFVLSTVLNTVDTAARTK